MLNHVSVASIVALAAVLSAAPDEGPGDPRVYGGVPTEGDEFSQVVSVQVGAILCTGTVVDTQLVLTAAHCFASQPDPADIAIKIGNDISSPEATVGATAWAQHPEFCIGNDCTEDIHDFAYIVLDTPLQFSDGFATPLSSQEEFDDYMRTGQGVWVVGYGEDEEGTKGVKRKVETSITKFTEQGGEFFAGGDGKDSCSGDSGGPALIVEDGRIRLAGVLSRGYDCGEGGVYGIPYPVLCWLRDETGVDLSDGCEACDCVDFSHPPGDENCRDCSVGAQNEPLGALFGLALIVAARRRRRA
jgi:V8-like Glu-specific endopeptidase